MKKEKKIYLEKDLLFLEDDINLVVHNRKNRRSIKISKEVFGYIINATERDMTIANFIECFSSEEDRKYMESLIEKMHLYNIINPDELNYSNRKKSIYFSLTNRCNLSCKHCITNATIDGEENLTYGNIMSILDKISKFNIENIVLTGGEPLIRNDIIPIIEYIREKKICKKIHLSTNATLIDESMIDFFVEEIDYIDISIDGIDEYTCSKVRGTGVFERVMNSINMLHNRDFFNISLSMVFDKNNVSLIEAFKRLNYDLKTIPIVRYLEPEGRARTNLDYYTDSKSCIPFSISEIAKKYIESNLVNENKFGPFSCNACIEQVFINYDGYVYPCPSLVYSDYCLGSALEYDFDVFLRDGFKENNGYKKFESLSPYYIERCKECNINLFCLKCPAKVRLIKDDERLFSEWCDSMKKNIYPFVWR